MFSLVIAPRSNARFKRMLAQSSQQKLPRGMSLRPPHMNQLEKRALEKCGKVAITTKRRELKSTYLNINGYIPKTTHSKLNFAQVCLANQKRAKYCADESEHCTDQRARRNVRSALGV